MINLLTRNWWMLVVRGVLAVLFGLAAFIWPSVTLGVLVLLFGAYAFVDGVFAIVAAFRDRDRSERWWVLLIEGLAGIVAGILTFLWPDITALVLLYLIAAWAVITGILEIVAAIRLRAELEGEWLLVLSGIASIIFGAILFVRPGAGALAVVWLIGAYAVVFGALLIALGIRLRSWAGQPTGPTPSAD
jgi:uncharacterized membrane protein HdeD (DUF308 family)